MEKTVVRYKIGMYWDYEPISFVDAAKKVNVFFEKIIEIDDWFKEMTMVATKKEKNVQLTFPVTFLNDEELGELLFKNVKFWLQKMFPNDYHDKYCTNHYGVRRSFVSKGKTLEQVHFSLCLGSDSSKNLMLIEFPVIFEKDLEWFLKLMSAVIDVFKPTYGGLYPLIMQTIQPPPPWVTGGWITYFADDTKFKLSEFNELKPRDFEGKTFYFIEDNHMYKKDEEQFDKLKALVDKFR